MTPNFRIVCSPTALTSAPTGWAGATLRDGELALLADGAGLEAIDAVAHALGLVSVAVVRPEATAEVQGETVMAYADGLPFVWVGTGFSDAVRRWAVERGQMTLLVEVDGPLPDAERGRIERFLSILTRQSE